MNSLYRELSFDTLLDMFSAILSFSIIIDRSNRSISIDDRPELIELWNNTLKWTQLVKRFHLIPLLDMFSAILSLISIIIDRSNRSIIDQSWSKALIKLRNELTLPRAFIWYPTWNVSAIFHFRSWPIDRIDQYRSIIGQSWSKALIKLRNELTLPRAFIWYPTRYVVGHIVIFDHNRSIESINIDR